MKWLGSFVGQRKYAVFIVDHERLTNVEKMKVIEIVKDIVVKSVVSILMI